MDLLEKQKELMVVLFECVNKIKNYESINNGIPNKETRLYESYIDAVYTEYQSLNESQIVSPINVNNHNNLYAYLKKVVGYYKEADSRVVKNLNESLKTVDNQKNKYDFDGFMEYVKQYVRALQNNNDFNRFGKKIIKIKSTLNQPIFVCGFPVNRFEVNNIKEIILDKTHNFVIIDCNDRLRLLGYSVNDDEYNYITEFYRDKICAEDLKFLESNLNNTKVQLIELLMEAIHRNFTKVYVSVRDLGLKFTDNLYKDAAQHALIADRERAKKLAQSNEILQQFFRTNFN